MELTKSANPSRTETSSSTIEIIDASGIRFLYVQTTLDPKKAFGAIAHGWIWIPTTKLRTTPARVVAYYLGLGSVLGGNSQAIRHSGEIDQRLRTHFAHYVAAVHFDRHDAQL